MPGAPSWQAIPGYVDNLAAGATTSFEVMGYDVPEYATIEAWGQSWSMPKL